MFAAAASLAKASRRSYLDDACRDDPALRAAVDSMLAAHDEAGSFGDAPVFATAEPARRLTPGAVVGSFRIEALIGAGGMGEVYRATDTRLRRAVAIKVLPDSFAPDAERRARFALEAQALASLNHPHIGAIYGLEEAGDASALILELVEGPTLAERLAAGPMPVDEIVRVATQLAEALEAAHDRGIIHRDLKPANIKMTPDGIVKVLDFGLAKAVGSPGEAAAHFSTAAQTRVGVVVGTAAYMSPEQARGQVVDKRTDIWAFGCVVFEMCARRPPFAGASVTDTLAAVIDREPDWQGCSATTPPYLLRLLRRCLTKDPKRRLRDIGEARILLARGGDDELAEPPLQEPKRRSTRIAVVGVGVLAAALAIAVYRRPAPAVTPAAFPVRFLVSPPGEAFFNRHPARTFFSLSPDGLQLAFVAITDRSRVWLRAMADLDARPLPGTEGAGSVFWSPDGRSLAFFADAKLKRIDVTGGPAVTICEAPAAEVMHGSWGMGGVILFGLSQGSAIYSVPAAGGTPREVLVPDRSRREVRVHFPWLLPDGKRFLYTARLDDGDGELRLGQVDGGSRTLMPLASNAQWVDPDVVVFAREGVLMGQRVDLSAARPVGEPFSIAERVEYFFTTSRAQFSASRNGTVAYHADGDSQQLLWVDQRGDELGTIGMPADYDEDSIRVSTNGDALLVARRQPGLGTFDIWRIDTLRQTEERVTADRGSEVTPVWIDSGRAILFAADRGGTVPHMFKKELATGKEYEMLPGGRQQLIMDVFPQDRAAAYLERSPAGSFDIFQLPLTAGAAPETLLASRATKFGMRLSPDGRAMAFGAVDGSVFNLYVAPVPVTSPPVLAATTTGMPRWSASGRELYYVADDRRMMTIPIRTSPTLAVGTPRRLFDLKRSARLFDVSADGRFLLLVPQVQGGRQPIAVATAAIGRPSS